MYSYIMLGLAHFLWVAFGLGRGDLDWRNGFQMTEVELKSPKTTKNEGYGFEIHT